MSKLITCDLILDKRSIWLTIRAEGRISRDSKYTMAPQKEGHSADDLNSFVHWKMIFI
jgi:hypothetical protein